MYPEIATIGPFDIGSFTLGPFTLYWFGAMMGIGFLVGAELTGRELARRGMDAEISSNILIAGAVGGLLGSRVWAIFNEWDMFIANPLAGLLSGAGFVWYGGLIGGTIAVSAVFRWHGIPWLRGADCAAPGLALGQAIGRIGCHLAGDGDWGSVTQVPWGVAYTNAFIGWPHPEGVLVHPTPLYEFAAYTLAFAFMWRRRRGSNTDGEVFALYLLTVPLARFVIEFVRINPAVFFGLSQAQVFSLALLATGGVLTMILRSRQQPPLAATVGPAATGQ